MRRERMAKLTKKERQTQRYKKGVKKPEISQASVQILFSETNWLAFFVVIIC